jgi:hypothetical protein
MLFFAIIFLCTGISLDYIVLLNCKEMITNSIKLRFDESSRTSLTGLSVLLRLLS